MPIRSALLLRVQTFQTRELFPEWATVGELGVCSKPEQTPLFD